MEEKTTMTKLELTLDGLVNLACYLKEGYPGRFAERLEHIEEILREGGNLWALADRIERDSNEYMASSTSQQIVHEIFWWLVQEMAEQNSTA
jgi:hypothetical protein